MSVIDNGPTIAMRVPEIDVVDANRDVLGESPVWDHKRGVLWWVDGIGRKIHRLDPSRGSKHTWSMNEEVGSIAVRARGGLVVAMRSGFYFFDPDTGQLSEVAKPETDRPKNRFNDGKLDRTGRFWSGTIQADRYVPRGRLWRLDPDHSTSWHMDGITCINGLSFSPDGQLMYMTDSFNLVIDVLNYDQDEGTIHGRRRFAEVPIGRGRCDGATVDADGCFWSANNDGFCVMRYDPRGRIDKVINLPVRRPTSLTFGGASLDILYITTATRRLPEKEIAQQPLAGCLLAVRPGVQGLPEAEFAG